ncbi:microtubule-associated protein 2-like [Saccostrea cucullata]|uniref:microtubule-associated protein 2-like n=1 Tax=Saccostrea cuccullata TaxID=36930 RepID=UPI002ED47BB3
MATTPSPRMEHRTKHPYPSLPSAHKHHVIGEEIEDEDMEAPIKTVVYVPNRANARGRFPVVSVHKKKDGRYVVMEQRPVHTFFSGEKFNDLKSLEEREDKLNRETKYKYVKPPWKWSSKGKSMERSFDRNYYYPYLPPINNHMETVTSKVGSLDNAQHSPRPSNKKVPHFHVHWEAEAKVGSLDNVDYKKQRSRSHPASEVGNRSDISEFETHSLKLPPIKTKYGGSGDVGSFGNSHFTPGTSKTSPRSIKSTARSKIGSLDNIHYVPGGGDVEIPHFPHDFKAESRIGSLEKVFHKPGGGDVQIVDLKPKWKSKPKVGSLENFDHTPQKSSFKVPHFSENFHQKAKAKIGSLKNIEYSPPSKHPQIFNSKPNWKKESKISALWKTKHRYDDPYDLEYDEDAEIEARIRELMKR